MKYKVLDTFMVGENTAVTIDGNGSGLKAGVAVHNEHGTNYSVESVAMVHNTENSDIGKSTTLLIAGKFTGNEINY